MLEATSLECQRGDRRLFSGVDLRLEAGEVLHVAGENGCGKTSLLRMLCGFSPPVAGEIRWQGEPIGRVRFGPNERVQGFLVQTARIQDLLLTFHGGDVVVRTHNIPALILNHREAHIEPKTARFNEGHAGEGGCLDERVLFPSAEECFDALFYG